MNSTTSLKLVILFIFATTTLFASPAPAKRDYYEIKTYILKSKAQEEITERFLKTAYLPALHRAGIAQVGVFKPIETDTAAFGKRIIVLIPFTSINQYLSLVATLDKDQQYQTAGAEYLNSTYDAAPFARIESVLLQAFANSPVFQVPVLTGPKAERIYELRSYESATEKIYVNKVKMFNAGDEIGLFKKLGFNAVFYGDVIAGSHMPNLMYMTSFNSISERNDHWKLFSADPAWKTLSAMPEYQHNVSHSDVYLLHPAEYSDL